MISAVRSRRHYQQLLCAGTLIATAAIGVASAEANNWKYEAVLTCSHGNTQFNIIACFAKSGAYGSDTELSVTRNGLQNLHKVYDFVNITRLRGSAAVGASTNISEGMFIGDDGLHLLLPNSFIIIAENSQEHLVLGIEIKNIRTGDIVYKEEVGHYGVIKVGN
jgi:hypothetical protein